MGKAVVITGASQGIGRAAAVRMSREPDVSDASSSSRATRTGLAGDRRGDRAADAGDRQVHPLRPDRPRRHPGPRRPHPRASSAASTSCSTSPATPSRKSLLDTTTENIVTTFTINVFAMLLLIREFVPLHARAGRPRSSTSRRPPASPRARAGSPTPRRRPRSCRCRRPSPTSWPAAASRSTASRPAGPPRSCVASSRPRRTRRRSCSRAQVADVIAQLMSDDERTLDGQNIIVRTAGLTGG